MRDIKYIIKRIIIGVGIATLMMLIRQNVYAYEWEFSEDVQIDMTSYSMPQLLYYNLSRSNSSPSYPVTTSGNVYNACVFGNTVASGYRCGEYYTFNRSVSRYYINGISQSYGSYTFQPNVNYYTIIPYGLYWNDQDYSISNNINETLVNDSSTYTSNSDKVEIKSALFSLGSDNEIEDSSWVGTYPKMYYWKINFTVTESVNNIYLYIGYVSNQNMTFTAFNTTTNTNWLIRSNNTCSAWSSSNTCYGYSTRAYKPFLYTYNPNDFTPVDSNDLVSEGTTDIKEQIGEIINGQFTDDLNFPYMNGGGMSFGDNEYTLQDLLIMPINFIRSIVTDNDTCVGISIPIPGLTGNYILPCPQSIAVSFLGQTIVDMIKLIIGCTVGFKIVTKLYNAVHRILDPEHLMYFDDIF